MKRETPTTPDSLEAPLRESKQGRKYLNSDRSPLMTYGMVLERGMSKGLNSSQCATITALVDVFVNPKGKKAVAARFFNVSPQAFNRSIKRISRKIIS